MSDELSLTHRDGLPDALRVLLDAYPRADWPGHSNFGGLVQFWLDRHLMFRRLCATLQADAQAAVDGEMDPQKYRARVSQLGGMLVNQLHGHHQIEDAHYFPVLMQIETRLERGFNILDRDHHDLDGLLSRFTDKANAVLQGGAAGPLLTEVEGFETFLNRHLEDEEDLVVPVILKHGPEGLT